MGSRERRLEKGLVFLMVVTLILLLGNRSISARDALTFNVSSTWAPDWPTNVFQQMWEDKVTKATEGRIKFKNFWGSSMTKMGEEMDALESGAVDISCMCSCFYPTAQPMNNICWGMFFIPSDPVVQAKIIRNLRNGFPQMDQEIEKHNCKLLFMSSVDTYGLFSRTPIRSVAELRGKKISGIGRYHPRYFKPIGAELISMHVADRYNAMQTGVLDGDFLPLLFTKPYRYWEVAKCRILVNSGGNHSMPHAMSMNAWKKLSPEDQKIFLDIGREMEMESALWTAKEADRFLKELQDKHGVQVISFPNEEKTKWCEAIGDSLWEYARDLQKAGLPGFEFVKAYIKHAEALGFAFPCSGYKNPPAK